MTPWQTRNEDTQIGQISPWLKPLSNIFRGQGLVFLQSQPMGIGVHFVSRHLASGIFTYLNPLDFVCMNARASLNVD